MLVLWAGLERSVRETVEESELDGGREEIGDELETYRAVSELQLTPPRASARSGVLILTGNMWMFVNGYCIR